MPYLGVKPADITSAAEAEVAGDLTVDTNTLKVDATNNRVGIGTASPSSAALHIDSGSDNANTLMLSDGATDGNIVDGFVTCRHHSVSEEPVLMIQGRSTSSENIVLIGGTHNNSTYNTATSIKFFTASGYTNTTPVEKMRVTGDGLTFNGDTAAANALDDYEEGTWTPAIYYQNSDDQTNSNNDIQTGFYVKVGTAVTAVCYLKWDATNSRANDNIGVSGLPFAGSTVSGQSNVRYTAAISYSGTSYPQGDSQVLAVVNPGNTLVSFLTANGGGNLGDEFGQNNNMEVRFTLQYVTN